MHATHNQFNGHFVGLYIVHIYIDVYICYMYDVYICLHIVLDNGIPVPRLALARLGAYFQTTGSLSTSIQSYSLTRGKQKYHTARYLHIFEITISPQRDLDLNVEDLNVTKCISDTNFLTVFHSNYYSVLLSFRDMTTGLKWTDDRQRTDE